MAEGVEFSTVGYIPSEWQTRFHMREENEVLGAGSAGPGKTECLIHDPLQQVMIEHARCTPGTPWHKRFPLKPKQSKGHALYLRRSSTMLDQIIARSRKIFPLMDPAVEWSEKKRQWTFSSGYRYQFGHCNDTDDYMQYYSNEYTWIGYDEVHQFEQIQYQEINNRLRCTDPVLREMLRVRLVSNPVPSRDTKNPHWIRDRFVKPFPVGNLVLKDVLKMTDGSEETSTRIYLPARLSDNPNAEFARQFEKNLRTNNAPHVLKALLDGDWFAAAGNFFECWNPDIHVIKPFAIPDDWPRWRAMDWGFKTHGVIGWFAMDEDGNVFMEREYTFIGKHDEEVARRAREIEEDLGLWSGSQSRITGPADNQLWEQRGDSAQSKAEVFRKMGVPWVQANKKSRADNASRVYKRLDDHNDGATIPGLVVFNCCVKTIETLPGIQTDSTDIECPLKGGDDHWYDMVSYSCAYASRGARGIPKKRSNVGHCRDDTPSKGRGTFGYS